MDWTYCILKARGNFRTRISEYELAKFKSTFGQYRSLHHDIRRFFEVETNASFMILSGILEVTHLAMPCNTQVEKSIVLAHRLIRLQ